MSLRWLSQVGEHAFDISKCTFLRSLLETPAFLTKEFFIALISPSRTKQTKKTPKQQQQKILKAT